MSTTRCYPVPLCPAAENCLTWLLLHCQRERRSLNVFLPHQVEPQVTQQPNSFWTDRREGDRLGDLRQGSATGNLLGVKSVCSCCVTADTSRPAIFHRSRTISTAGAFLTPIRSFPWTETGAEAQRCAKRVIDHSIYVCKELTNINLQHDLWITCSLSGFAERYLTNVYSGDWVADSWKGIVWHFGKYSFLLFSHSLMAVRLISSRGRQPVSLA